MSANTQSWNVLAVHLVYWADTDVGAGKTSHAGEEEWPWRGESLWREYKELAQVS